MTTEFTRNGLIKNKKQYTVYSKKYTRGEDIVYELTKEETDQVYLTSDIDKPIREYFDDAYINNKEDGINNKEDIINNKEDIKKRGPGKQKNILSFLSKKK